MPGGTVPLPYPPRDPNPGRASRLIKFADVAFFGESLAHSTILQFYSWDVMLPHENSGDSITSAAIVVPESGQTQLIARVRVLDMYSETQWCVTITLSQMLRISFSFLRCWCSVSFRRQVQFGESNPETVLCSVPFF